MEVGAKILHRKMPMIQGTCYPFLTQPQLYSQLDSIRQTRVFSAFITKDKDLRTLAHNDPTKTPCSNISGSHYKTPATFKLSQNPIPFILTFITVDG